jgi:hypothetical protein
MLDVKLLGNKINLNPKAAEVDNKNKSWNKKNRDQKSLQIINRTKTWLFEKINKIDKYLSNVTKRRWERTQSSKKWKRGITSTNEIQGIIREFFENLHLNKLENLEEMDKFPDAYDQPKLNQEDKTT